MQKKSFSRKTKVLFDTQGLPTVERIREIEDSIFHHIHKCEHCLIRMGEDPTWQRGGNTKEKLLKQISFFLCRFSFLEH